MSTEKHSIKNSIVSIVVGGLILSFIWWTGFFPNLWNWIKNLPSEIGEFLTWDMSIPMWLYTLLSIPLIIIVLGWASAYLTEHSTKDALDPANTDQDNSEPKHQLSSNELAVLSVIADEDGEALHLSTISTIINLNNLRTDQAIESLIQKDYINKLDSIRDGTRYYLSSKGRNLAIELGYA